MVNVSIDVTDLGGEARPGDKVVFWRPRMGGSATHAGRVISTAPVTVFLEDGKATVSNVEPGAMSVLLQCRGMESQGPVTVGVPDGDRTVTLRALLESQFEYAPPIVSAVQEAAANASASEEAAIRAQVRSEAAADRADAKVDDAINNGAALVRGEVKQDADRAVAARQAAVQSESNAKASEDAAATSESNAAASESAAKQSETNAGDFAAVATTAATEAVDAMGSVSDIIGAKYATQEYVDNGLAPKADKSELESKASKEEVEELRPKRGATDANLNTLMTEGGWYWPADAETSTDRGFPVAKAGRLNVNRWHWANGAVVQTYIPFRHEGIFVRFIYGGNPYEGGAGSGWMEYRTGRSIMNDVNSITSSTSTQIVNDAIARLELPPAKSSMERISCIGDSLTRGYSASATWDLADSYPSRLANALGVSVENRGFSGATTNQINLRVGAQKLTFRLVGGAIEEGRYKNVSLITGQHDSVWSGAGVAFNVYGYLAGRYGLLKYDGANYIFTTADAGEAVSADVAVFEGEFRDDCLSTIIYAAGRNDITKRQSGLEGDVVDSIMRGYADMLAFAAPRVKQVAFMGTITRTDETPGSQGFEEVYEVRRRLREQYPDRFIDLQGYLTSSRVWDDTGITPTSVDLEAQSVGRTPPSLFDDVTHYSRATADAIANSLVAPWLLEKGWVLPPQQEVAA